MSLTRNQTIALSVILFAGLLFRIYGLGSESLWLDEGYSVKFAGLDMVRIFLNQENNPPLYFMVLHWWIGLFGDSEFSVRFPSFVFGVLSIFMIYKVGTLIFDKNTGILSSLLLTLSAFHIAFSQEARTFSLTVLLALLSIYFFVTLLNKKSRAVVTGYVLFSALLIYSHIYGLFVIAAQNIYFISSCFFLKKNSQASLKLWFLSQVALIVLFSPWVSIFLDRISFVQGGFWIERPDMKTISETFISYSEGSKLLLGLYLILATLSIISCGTNTGKIEEHSSLMCIKIHKWEFSLLSPQKIYFLLLWLFVPIALPFIISCLSTPIYHIKYTLPALPAFYLLIARGTVNIKSKFIKLIIIVTAIAFSLPAIRWYHNTVHKAQWREVVGFIDSNVKADDILLFNTFISKDLLFNYYSGRDDLIKKNDLIKKDFPERNRDEVDEKYLEDLNQTVKGHNRVWVVLSISGKNKELIKKKLLESYDLSCRKKYVGIIVYLFEKREGIGTE